MGGRARDECDLSTSMTLSIALVVNAVTATLLASHSLYTDGPIGPTGTWNTLICVNYLHESTFMCLEYHHISLERLFPTSLLVQNDSDLPTVTDLNRPYKNFTSGPKRR